MSTLLADDALVDDMAAALYTLRGYFMQIAEEHPDMNTTVLDDLLRRYTAETGRTPPRATP